MTESHHYNDDGILVAPFTPGSRPSVTTLLAVRDKPRLDANNLRLGEAEAVARQITASDKGTKVHKAIESFLSGLEPELDDDTLPYFVGFRKWLEKEKPTILHSEKFVLSKKYNYAGTIDLLCVLDDGPWIIDFKTSKHIDRGMGLQLAAYQQAWKEMTGETFRTGILQLAPKDKDGNYLKRGYRFKELNEPFEVFLAHQAIYNWDPKSFERF